MSQYQSPRRLFLSIPLLIAALLCLDSAAYAQGPKARARKLTADLAKYTAALSGADEKAAIAAADWLAKVKDERALDALLDGLAMGLGPAVATAALTAVAQHAQPRGIDIAEFYTRYRDAKVRAAAVGVLGGIDDRRTAGPTLAALSDNDKDVRAVAVGFVASRNLRAGIEPMIALLVKGDEATVPALASLANPELAKALGEYIGEAPNALLADTLGRILLRKEFGPESARVQVVKILGKISGPESMMAMRKYIDSLPAASLRQSKRQAEATIKDILSGGKPAPKSDKPGAKKP